MSSLNPLLEKLISNRHLKLAGKRKKKKGEQKISAKVEKITKIHNEASHFIGLFNGSTENVSLSMWTLNTHLCTNKGFSSPLCGPLMISRE